MATRVVLLSANRHKDPYAVYPLGTAYLKSYLDDHLSDSQVVVWDMNMGSVEDMQHFLVEFDPQYVCVSIRNVDGANSLDRRGFLPQYVEIIDAVKSVVSTPIIVGGAAFSIFPEVFMAELGADYGITGEGEWALCELIDSLRRGVAVDQIPKLYTPEGSLNSHTCNYLTAPQSTYESNLVEYYWRESGMLNIQTKRGCPYNCIYCTYPVIDGRVVRCMDIDMIIETIKRAKSDFGANYWFFTDSVFNIKNDYNMRFAEALVKSGVDISWGAYFSPSNLTDEQVALFKASGLTHIEFGTESFCDETLECYGKHFTFDDVLRASELALKHNVYYSHFLILAGLGESRERLHQTIENSRHLHHTVIFPYVGMRVYPGTALQRSMIESGLLSPENDLMAPEYYLTEGFDLEQTRTLAHATGKAWVFPDEPMSEGMVQLLKIKRNKKGPLWEFLRKP